MSHIREPIPRQAPSTITLAMTGSIGRRASILPSGHGLGLDDHVVGRLLDRLGQEVSDRAETQQLDGEGHLMQGSAQNLGGRMFVQPEIRQFMKALGYEEQSLRTKCVSCKPTRIRCI
ncbi:hypothetical protein WR25_08192 [Diploscapter pachys]|uniref:Uncharacterized protein n=1 Tax=Diploscapter pachys TaxID=2018661 RepID=A0A2A2L9U6_9BILA|nr:hypothetical protein WR25_08192 [Diploscapter pachys]